MHCKLKIKLFHLQKSEIQKKALLVNQMDTLHQVQKVQNITRIWIWLCWVEETLKMRLRSILYFKMLSHPCISGWWGVVRWKERTGFWVRLAGKCRGNTKEASVTFSSRIQIITIFQDIRIMMILGDLCRDDFWEIYAKMISRRFEIFSFSRRFRGRRFTVGTVLLSTAK